MYHMIAIVAHDWLQGVFWRHTANMILNREVVFANFFDNLFLLDEIYGFF